MSRSNGKGKGRGAAKVISLLSLWIAGLSLLVVSSNVQVARAYSSSTIAEECFSETTGCTEEDTCQECYMASEAIFKSETYTECQKSYLDDEETELTVCEELWSIYCCANQEVESDCMANDPNRGYWSCFMELKGCMFEEVSCFEINDNDDIDDDSYGIVLNSKATAGPLSAMKTGVLLLPLSVAAVAGGLVTLALGGIV